ncbi:hypothetical protein AX14_003201 [Amanita brunnescens Koide BX004]|nr:hypothetical protein AX14_003201 [Amanita brunnescens Koide BX004]
MSSDSNTNNIQTSESVHHSDPIPIASRFGRGRSASVSSASSGSSSAFDIPTPMSSSTNSQHAGIPSPSGSPILSYFLAQSPTKAHAFPFKRSFAPPTVLEDEEADKNLPVVSHMRRASMNVAGRFGQPQSNGPIPDSQMDRGAGFLRRLSLGGSSFAKIDTSPTSPSPPSPPPNTATSPSIKFPTLSSPTKHRRATTAGENGRTRRAPSPMGERILKGHFDGFN